MPGVDTRTPVRVPDKINKFNIPSSLELQTGVVDSLSPPQTAEYTSARHALAQDCATLELIDKDIEECRLRIARAQAQMRLLQRQRNALESCISIHHARLSPLRTIPDQILQEIFQHCLPGASYVVPSVHSAPLVLTHVCRRWRSVAHGTSELWSSIALQDRGVWNYELELEMVQRWLSRSRMRPVCMSIACPPYTDFGANEESDVFQLVIAHTAHLRDLHLNVNKSYLTHFLSRAHSLPALRSITIALDPLQPIDEPEPVPFVSAPCLRHMALHGATSIHLLPRALFSHITHLALDCPLDLACLHDFSHLSHLTLTLALPRDRFQLPAQRSVSASLRQLEICLDRDMLRFGDPETLAELLDHLELPVLETLVVSVPYDTGTADGAWLNNPSVHGLLASSQCAARLERRVLGTPGRHEEFESEA